MDSLSNYQGLISAVGEVNKIKADDLSSKEAEAKDRIKEFTAPFEMTATDHLVDLLGGQAEKFGKKYGLKLEKAKQYAEAYRQNGARGVLNQASNDIQAARNAASVPEGGRAPATKALRLEDMTDEEFSQVKGITKQAIDAQVQQLSPIDKQLFTQDLKDRVTSADIIPNDIARFKANQQHAIDSLERVKSWNQNVSNVDVHNGPNYNAPNNNASMDSQLKSQLTNVTDDDDAFQGGLKSTTQVFANKADAVEQVAQKAEKVESKGKEFLNQASKLGEDVGKGAVEGEEGGPLGDIVGAAVGVGTFLSGLFAARHAAHHVSAAPILNYAIQEGS